MPSFELFKDINPGSASSDPSSIFEVQSKGYFSATGTSGKGELWVTDGTQSGTRRLLDPNLYPDVAVLGPNEGGDGIFFTTSAHTQPPGEARDLWELMNPGTNTSPRLMVQGLGKIEHWGSWAQSDNSIILSNSTSLDGNELAIIDIATGQLTLVDLVPGQGDYGPNSGDPTKFERVGSIWYFNANTSSDRGSNKIWRSDGSAAGTFVVSPTTISGETYGEGAIGLRAAGNGLYFTASIQGSTNPDRRIWRLDVTDPVSPSLTRVAEDVAASFDGIFINNGAGHAYTQSEVWTFDAINGSNFNKLQDFGSEEISYLFSTHGGKLVVVMRPPGSGSNEGKNNVWISQNGEPFIKLASIDGAFGAQPIGIGPRDEIYLQGVDFSFETYNYSIDVWKPNDADAEEIAPDSSIRFGYGTVINKQLLISGSDLGSFPFNTELWGLQLARLPEFAINTTAADQTEVIAAARILSSPSRSAKATTAMPMLTGMLSNSVSESPPAATSQAIYPSAAHCCSQPAQQAKPSVLL
jgi:ELWxxDGT repeat protein